MIFVFCTACKQKSIPDSEPTVSVPSVEQTVPEKVIGMVYQENSNIEEKEKSYDNSVKTSPNLESWVGDYEFSEFAPPNINMFYGFSIYRENGNYYAKISIDGFQTIKRLQANVSGDENSIKLIFAEYLPDNRFEPYIEEDILLSLEKRNSYLCTNWGKIQPILESNMKPSEVHFKQNQNSQSTTNEIDIKSQKSFYGEWEVKRILAYAQIFAEEEAKGLIGIKLTYGADVARSANSELKKPFYKQTKVSKNDFESGNRVSFKSLGIEGNSIIEVIVHKDSINEYDWEEIGSYFYINDNNTLIIPAGGKFFEVIRTLQTNTDGLN